MDLLRRRKHMVDSCARIAALIVDACCAMVFLRISCPSCDVCRRTIAVDSLLVRELRVSWYQDQGQQMQDRVFSITRMCQVVRELTKPRMPATSWSCSLRVGCHIRSRASCSDQDVELELHRTASA